MSTEPFVFREPDLCDLLNDPIVGLVMKSDGVSRSDVLSLLGRVERARPTLERCCSFGARSIALKESLRACA